MYETEREDLKLLQYCVSHMNGFAVDVDKKWMFLKS